MRQSPNYPEEFDDLNDIRQTDRNKNSPNRDRDNDRKENSRRNSKRDRDRVDKWDKVDWR